MAPPALDEATKSKILKQVDFYFSDSNLPKDKFLREKVGEDVDGFVDLKLICSFSRIRELLKFKGKEVDDERVAQIAEVIKAGSTFVTLSEDSLRIKRTDFSGDTDLDAVNKAVDARSVYASPFPLTTTIESVMAFFKAAKPVVLSVRMRRHTTSKDFKGSVFVEFETPEDAKAVTEMALENEGASLLLELKPDYLQRKIRERKEKPERPAAPPSAREPAPKDKPEAKAPEPEPEPEPIVEGLIVKVTVPDGTELTREQLKEAAGGPDAGVDFIEYSKGGTGG
eukprot:CAMPEP_0182912470 /NCGR_PEP_ID=MMETSP0034_2-20130328/37532_1 /TAXON_ID=156128 /ORGANISM="Nephroselmis pyriformis, Strain CCMP717" /LENGTH=282 /DNA_ID=CAMNT_0025049145 /DNA_START=26 /DNA_END=870 /DNA_ORIENTATION=+